MDWWAIGAAAINFILLLWILARLGRKPLASFLTERRATIEQEIAEASRLKKEAQEKHAEYEARLKALDQEIATLRQEMVDAGVAERDRIIADAQAKAERMRKDTQFLIDQQLKQLRIDLTREAVSAAVEAAGQELQKATTAQDQERIAREYLARVAKGGQA
jgi:F-type H+-transporting ATPase subunit b